MKSRVEFSIGLGRADGSLDQQQPREETPIRILVLGDFTGRNSKAKGDNSAIIQRTPKRLDIDNFDQVLGKLAPRLDLNVQYGHNPVSIRIHEIEDFHPDQLVRRDPDLQELSTLKQQLTNPSTFTQAAGRLRALLAIVPEEHPTAKDSPTPAVSSETDSETLERLLGSKATGSTSQSPKLADSRMGIDDMIRRVVSPHLTPTNKNLDLYLDHVDNAAGARLRAILQHADFKGLESAWRSLYWLVTNIETDEGLEIHLFDISKDELRDDLANADDGLLESGCYRRLFGDTAGVLGAVPWSIIIGDYTFDSSSQDISLLSAIGKLGSIAGVSFIGGAHPSICGCADLNSTPHSGDWDAVDTAAIKRWNALRNSAEARWISLALPRVLLRLPYGQDTEPCETFPFSEMPPIPEHEAFLWGNPSFACAFAFVESCHAQEQGFPPAGYTEIEDLPAYTYRDGDASVMQACAEVYLSEHSGQIISDRGCIPLFSFKNRNRLRIGPMQTLAMLPPKSTQIR